MLYIQVLAEQAVVGSVYLYRIDVSLSFIDNTWLIVCIGLQD